VTIADDEPPTITCSTNIDVPNDAGVCEAVVDYATTTWDNCAGETFSVDAGLPSGSTFPVDTTTNTLSVVDAVGNVGGKRCSRTCYCGIAHQTPRYS
jgi:hypothetical protein